MHSMHLLLPHLLLFPLALLLLPALRSSLGPVPVHCDDFARTNLSPSHPVSSHTQTATAITWSFDDGTDGWARSTPTEMSAHVHAESGSLLVSFSGEDPHLDSGRMRVLTNDRHAVAIRYKYTGGCNVGKVVLRGNTEGNAFDPVYVDDSAASWTAGESGTDFFEEVFFPIVGDGEWRTTYARFQARDPDGVLVRAFDGVLQQIRLHPAADRAADPGGSYPSSPRPVVGTAVRIDWMELASAPAVERVTGCNGERYHSTISFSTSPSSSYQLTQETLLINSHLSHHKTVWERRMDFSAATAFGRVYNCVREGGEIITIEGRHLGQGGVTAGSVPATVLIGTLPCTGVVHDPAAPQTRLTCVTPPAITAADVANAAVTVLHGTLPGLNDTVPFFSYAVPPPSPVGLEVSNAAASSFDVSWEAGGGVWEQMTVTGYEVVWRLASEPDWTGGGGGRMTVGNVTTTTVRNLAPGSEYVVAVSAAAEDQGDGEWQAMDKYGRRALLAGGLLGAKTVDVYVTTLSSDFAFPSFSASLTLDLGPDPSQPGSTPGPTGVAGGEGHYGLYIVGDANIENCNSSVVCCDGYDHATGSCPSSTSQSCSAAVHPDPSYRNGEVVAAGRRVPDNLPGGEKWVATAAQMAPLQATAACGPALRLTASSPRLSGAAWYRREQEVGEGFDTSFTFRVANPSLRCDVMDDVHTNCRSRGADGFAFVIQEDGPTALGGAGENLGYGGITNSLAVEFDTYYNSELLEPYENHVSVHTRGHREANSPDQAYSLGHTNEVRDLTDGEIEVRIRYEPTFDQRLLANPRFVTTPHVSHFLENADFKNGGQGDWGVGMGTLQVFLENDEDAVLIVPLSLEATLSLNHGRAWVGFTSSTGFNTWQVHDILSWTFTSLRMESRMEEEYRPPGIVGGENAFGCSGVDGDVDCKHK